MYTIVQKLVHKHGSRGAFKPIIIVDHISAGSMGSMYNTFSNPRAKSASSTYGVSREGEIVQYVPIDRAPWTQGNIRSPKAPIIKAMGVNPNLYAVSIEHEGYEDEDTGEYHGLRGDITPAQYAATRWLHKYIQHEVERLYGHRIALNAANVIGHYQIDSIDKPYCPGPLFPWHQLYADLAIVDGMTLTEAEELWDYANTPNAQIADIVAVHARVDELTSRLNSVWAIEAARKLQIVDDIVQGLGFDQEGATAQERIAGLYKTFLSGGEYKTEAHRKLYLIAAEAKKHGLIA